MVINLQDILEKHIKWLNDCDDEEGGRANLREAELRWADLSGADLREAELRWANLSGADLREANLCGANLRGANLREADLRGANLRGADLREAELRWANLSGADLREANLRGANLRGANLREAELRWANLSGCKGLLSPIDYLKENFEKTKKGYICYKIFNANYPVPDYWKIQENSIITEVVNPSRTTNCTCGVNVGTLKWAKDNNDGDKIWKCLIEWEWLVGVVVPYNTDGKIRCEKVRLLEVNKC